MQTSSTNVNAIDQSAQEKLFLEDAEAGLIENVKKHIESNVNVKAMDGERRTALHRASLEGHPVIVKMILDALQKLGNQTATVSFINRHDAYGNTAIYLACVHPQTTSAAIVKHLLEFGANRLLRKTTTGMTPLHWAAYNGDAEVVNLLLNDRAGAQAVVARNKDNKTALDIAGEQYVKLIIKRINGEKHNKPLINNRNNNIVDSGNIRKFRVVVTRILNMILPNNKQAKRFTSIIQPP